MPGNGQPIIKQLKSFKSLYKSGLSNKGLDQSALHIPVRRTGTV